MIKVTNQDNRKTLMKEKEHIRISTNGEMIDLEISNRIFKIIDRNREYDSIKMFIIRLRYGGLSSLDNGFSIPQKDAFINERHKLLYFTRRCEQHGCVSTVQHTLFECKTVPNEVVQKCGHNEEKQWWDSKNVDLSIDDDLAELEPPPKKRRTISDYYGRGEGDSEEDEVKELRNIRARDENLANIRRLRSRQRANPARRGYVTSEHVGRNEKEKHKRKKRNPREETYDQFYNFMKYLQTVYSTFWKDHIESIRKFGSEKSKILDRFFNKTTIT